MFELFIAFLIFQLTCYVESRLIMYWKFLTIHK